MYNSDNTDTTTKKSRRWPWIVLTVLFVIVIAVRLSLTTGVVHNWVKNKIIQAVEGSINAHLEIGTLKGDLWKEIQLIDMKIVNSDTLFSADTLQVRYDLLSYFSSEFQVESVDLAHPVLKATEEENGSWNVQKLLRESPESETSTDSSFPLNINRFSLTGGEIEGRFNSADSDSIVTVQHLQIEGGFGYYGESFDLRLRELGFEVSNTRFSSPLTVQSSVQATDRKITLEKLVIATGVSMMQSSAVVDMVDSTTSLNFVANPLSWRDLSAYLDRYPSEKNLQIDLSLKGNLREFEVLLETEAEGLQGLFLNAGFRWGDELVLRHMEIKADKLDLPTFFSEPAYPGLIDLQLLADGTFNFSQKEQATMKGGFSAQNVVRGEYHIDHISGTFSLDNDQMDTETSIIRSDERVTTKLAVSNVWDEVPVIRVRMEGKNIDPSYWLQNPEYRGDVNLTARLDGEGYLPSDSGWNYELHLRNSTISGQNLSTVTFKGQVDSSRFTTESTVRLRQSKLFLKAEVSDYMGSPGYQYDLTFDELNLAECRGLEDFKTTINGSIRGEGKYITPEQLELTSTVSIDSSVVNDEFIEKLNARMQVRDTVANISDAVLNSTIADGSFDARIHLLDLYNIENRLNLDVEVKDPQSFAPLMEVETLEAGGTVNGTLNPVNGKQLQFKGAIDFRDVVYNDMLTSERIQGNIEVLLSSEPEYVFNLNLSNPVINSVVLQDVESTIRGKATPDSTFGAYQLRFSSADDSQILQSGQYNFGRDNIRIHTDDLRVISSLRSLTLAKPFDLEILDHSFRMDTLELTSDDGASLEMAIPYADSLTQRGFLQGRQLNLTVIQNALLNEAYFEGILSGSIRINREDTAISSTGDLIINNLVYQGTELDSLGLNYRLQNDRLEGALNLYDGRARLAEGRINLPFRLGDPSSFPPSFFDEEVSGHLRVRKVAVKRFQEILSNFGISITEGAFQFSGTLQGRAGEPDFDAAFRLTNTVLSGVALDSVTAVFDYNHGERIMAVNASVMSLKQKAAELTARMPLHVDLKNVDLTLPTENDSVHIDITTNRFNLAALNDFVNRSQVREITGRLDGSVAIVGPLKDLKTDGKLNFRDGAIRIVKAGIKVDNIRSEFLFDKNTLQVSQFRARSGGGTFSAGGSIKFNQLEPGNVDIKMEAENFRIANTSEYNAIVDMSTRLGGTILKPSLKGKLSFVSGYLYLQNFGEKSVEAVKLDTTAGGYDYFVQYDSLSLDMDISFNRRFYVRNRRYLDLEYELEGQLDMVKEAGQEMQMFGSLSAVDGYSRPLGKRFQLEEGVITFAGDPTNPQMNVRHLFEPPQQELGDVRIWYVIEGTVESPKFKYESEPEMGLEDIISYTLFGKPFMSLDSWKQVVANSGSNASAADVAMDVLLDRVETLATQRLGIDVVQIDNTRRGTDTGTSIKTGWYLNPKVFFAIQNVIAGSVPETIFILEYRLQKNLKLIRTQGSDSQTGLDLKWNYDY